MCGLRGSGRRSKGPLRRAAGALLLLGASLPAAAQAPHLEERGQATQLIVDGKEFDSSWTRGEPATFPLNRLIKGWQVAVPKAGVGDTIEIAIPADLAYGPIGKGPIPGDATLFFKIELLGIEPAAAQ